MAKLKLSQVPTGSSFIDSNSTYNGNVLEWCVVAHGTDGEGISTLILKSPLQSIPLAFDAQEPLNPDSTKRDKGNTSYEYSNLLQFLNSDGLANEWYTPQHEYDQSPIYPYVNADSNAAEYAKSDAFLAHFDDNFKEKLIPVTKMGVTRKVHLPAVEELVKNKNQIWNMSDTDIVYDVGTMYGTYNFPTFSGTGRYFALFRATHDSLTPKASIQYSNGSLYYIGKNEGTRSQQYPWDKCGFAIPVIYVDSNSPVEYNTTDQKYYASWDKAPVLTVQDINTWQSSAFNIIFNVTDADMDTVSTTVKVDDTTIYSNAVTPLGSNITVSTAGIFGTLANGEHEISIVCNDGEKTATFDVDFKKVNVAPVVLHSVSENRVFVDRNTKINGEPIEWVIAAKDVDGKRIVTLMAKKPIYGYCFDAREVYNPNSDYVEYGNPNYGVSNILQWLNSEDKANEWFENQHEYDYPPNSTEVGGTYSSVDGFLHDFSDTLKNAMQFMTKMGESRKVHIPSYTELLGNDTAKLASPDVYMDYFDHDTKYTAFNVMSTLYKSLVTKPYPNSTPFVFVRYNTNYRTTGVLTYALASTSAYWTRDGYALWSAYPKAIYGYTIPVIYLAGDNVPVVYDSESLTYYLDFAISTQYEDYGKHKDGFSVKVKVDCSTPIGDTVVKFYIDDNPTEVYTTTISTYNEYASVTLPDSAVEDLENGEHIITIKSDTYGILGSTSTKYTKVDESVPIILTDSIGHITEPFNKTYRVYDDDGDSLNVTIKLNGTVISTITDAEQNVDLPLTLTTAQFNNINYGDHTIVIEATDGVNTSTATLPFTKNSVPTIELNVHELDVQLEPFSVEVTTNSADGENITVRAYIDNQEITV